VKEIVVLPQFIIALAITALPLAAVITIGIGTATSEIIREITSLRLRMSFLLA